MRGCRPRVRAGRGSCRWTGSRGSALSEARKASRAASRRPAVASAAPSRLCPRAWRGLAVDEHPGLGDGLIGAAVEEEQRRRVVAGGVGRRRDAFAAGRRPAAAAPCLRRRRGSTPVARGRRRRRDGARRRRTAIAARLLDGAGRGQEAGTGPVWASIRSGGAARSRSRVDRLRRPVGGGAGADQPLERPAVVRVRPQVRFRSRPRPARGALASSSIQSAIAPRGGAGGGPGGVDHRARGARRPEPAAPRRCRRRPREKTVRGPENSTRA